MKSIRWKLVFIYFTLVFIVMIVSGTYIIIMTDSQETKNAEEELKQCAVYVEEQIINEYENPDDFQLGFDNFFIVRSSMRNIQANIIDKDGKTIASSVSSDKSLFMDYNNSVVISALSGKESFDTNKKYMDFNSQVKDWITYGYPVFDNDNQVKYVIYTQIDGESIKNNIMTIAGTISVSIVIALVITGVLGIIFASTITRPIELLTKKAKQLAHGRKFEKLPVRSNDEIGQLTRSFNYMASELRKTLSEFENENNKLEIVVNNMTDGILAFDYYGKLIHANSVCQELLGHSTEGLNLQRFLAETNMKNISLTPNVISETMVKRENVYLSISFIPYGQKDADFDDEEMTFKDSFEGVVVVLQNITKHRRLDEMRREFVANVSHEIRTPLTTIKSYAETLIDGAIDEKETAIEFLQIINAAADRVAFLAKDLLDLSHLDNKQMKFNFENVNIISVLRDCITQNYIAAQNKKQNIIFDCDEDKVYTVSADVGRITQVFNNIISNAMKYSPENTNINIFAEDDKDFCYIHIKDNGIGIPEDDLERIFERFYRVDKARSRAMGGNGLGLSIAKEIMEGHKGKIYAESSMGNGTDMILKFPKVKNK